MIHTGMLTYSRISKKLMQDLIQLPDTISVERNIWVNRSRKDDGITLIISCYRQDKYIFNTVSCRVNFSKLVGKAVTSFSAPDYHAMVLKFNRIMGEFGLPVFAEWTARRIDYCVDVHTPYVKEYIHLLQKADIPYYQKIAYNALTKNRSHGDGSIYLPAKSRDRRSKKTGSMTINFYDKQDERVKAGSSDEIIAESKGILRLEVQCYKPKLNYIKKKYGLDDTRIDSYMQLDICEEVIEKALFTICKKGDYYRRSVALEHINDSNYQAKTKQILTGIVNDVSKQKQSIARARCKYSDAGMDSKRFNSYLHKLDDLGINPVMIPDNLKLEGLSYKDGLPNLYDLFIDALEKEFTGVAGEEWNDEPAVSYTIETLS